MNDHCCTDPGHVHDTNGEDEIGVDLRSFVSLDKIRALNASDPADAPLVFKSYSTRSDATPCLKSNEDDPELLLFVPFSEGVKIKSICVQGGSGGAAPTGTTAEVVRWGAVGCGGETLCGKTPCKTLC